VALSSPTDFKDFSLLMALQPSTSKLEQGIKFQKNVREGESQWSNSYYEVFENAW
jgi:hypothetical protein